MKRSSQVGTKIRRLEDLYRDEAEWEGPRTGGETVSVGGKEREREWKVPGKCLGCEGTLGDFRLSQQQTGGIWLAGRFQSHTWTCGGPDLNTAPCGSRITLFLFWPPVSWGCKVGGVQQGGSNSNPGCFLWHTCSLFELPWPPASPPPDSRSGATICRETTWDENKHAISSHLKVFSAWTGGGTPGVKERPWPLITPLTCWCLNIAYRTQRRCYTESIKSGGWG